ncbi:MAG: alpha/beta fold hydrolase [Myxococcota bacterium]|nr:alpha/beta fold hydrolase [Myxococcota bacterium]
MGADTTSPRDRQRPAALDATSSNTEDSGMTTPADSGQPALMDAGSTDSGTVVQNDASAPSDSGTTMDASAPIMDASAPIMDAGTSIDSGTAGPRDSGTTNPSNSPNGIGPAMVATQTETVVRSRRTTNVEVYLPTSNTPSPVVVFIPGFRIDSVHYAPLMQRIASHGFVVLRADPPDPFFGSDHNEMAADIQAVIDWALDPQNMLSGSIDSANIGVFGHSLGGKIATMAAFIDTRITALLGIDPVNAGGPTGFSMGRPDILPGQIAMQTIPIGILGETTDDGLMGGLMACAPDAGNFKRFYDAATTTNWIAEWDFVGADHMDFVEDTCGFICNACRSGTANKPDVLAATQTLSVAFFRRHLKAEMAMESWLTGANIPSATTITPRSRP